MSLQKCSAWFAAICLDALSGLTGTEAAELHLDEPCGHNMENLLLGGSVISIDGRWKIQNL